MGCSSAAARCSCQPWLLHESPNRGRLALAHHRGTMHHLGAAAVMLWGMGDGSQPSLRCSLCRDQHSHSRGLRLIYISSRQMPTNNKSSQRKWDPFQTAQRGMAASFVSSKQFAQTLKDVF